MLRETGDRFGFALAAADLDCDDFTDLVVGSPYEDAGGTDSGLVQIIWGTATGLGTGRGSATLDPATFGNIAHVRDQFGYAVVCAGDRLAGLGRRHTRDAGWVGFQVAYDGDNVELEVTQDSPGIPGAANLVTNSGPPSRSATCWATGGPSTLRWAPPTRTSEPRGRGGSDHRSRPVLRSGRCRLRPEQPGRSRCGRSRRPVRSDPRYCPGRTHRRLAVGVPGEDIGSATDAGSVQLFSGNGSSLTPGVGLSQNTAGVSGVGSQVTCSASGSCSAAGAGRPSTRVAVSTPRENGSRADSGLVRVFPVTDSRRSDLEPGQHRCNRRRRRG